MKTEKTTVSGKCYIWALPMTDYQVKLALEEVDGDMEKVTPFKYEITASCSNWHDGAVRVCEFDVVGTVPEGIDLVKQAVETLRDEIIKVRKDADDKIADLEEQIKNLALIEYKPAENDEAA